MIDDWAFAIAALGLVVGIAAVTAAIWYEHRQAEKWSEYGRRIDDEGGAP